MNENTIARILDDTKSQYFVFVGFMKPGRH